MVTQEGKLSAIERLHAGVCSCVICRAGRLMVFHERGVRDLFKLLNDTPEMLAGAFVADKVVGKGAAALMIAGGVAGVFADVISQPALDLLAAAGVEVEYLQSVTNIINRSNTGICPVEELCSGCQTASECLPLITRFMASSV